TDYLYRDGLLLAAETQTGQRHFHLDHLGTPRLITRGSGFQAAYHVYYPFGEEATAFNQDSEKIKFTGHERDLASPADSGDDLDYMHARFYGALTGRFLELDPIDSTKTRLPQSWNKYAYVRDNPVNLTDPTGRCVEDACIGEIMLVGALAEFITSSAMTGYVLHRLYSAVHMSESTDEKPDTQSETRTKHGEQRAKEASEGDAHRQVGDANRVKQEGREYVDSETGAHVYVKGDRVVITNEKGAEITRYTQSRAKTLKRVQGGKWVPVQK
ncbi:MAG: RHS repeat-associated core domain-containing protein, partial [Thermoanaerobaculia bacterium]